MTMFELVRANRAGAGSAPERLPLNMPTTEAESANGTSNRDEIETSGEEEDDLPTVDITDEDASMIIGVSISRAATRLTSAKTPAVEKAAALDYFQGEEYTTESEEDLTPPALEEDHSAETQPAEGPPKLSLKTLPPAQPQPAELPSPWVAGPKPISVDRSPASRSVLKEALGTTKRRSSSGSGDAIRKYLPSLSGVGNLLPNLPFSASTAHNHKSRSRGHSFTSSSPPKHLLSSSNQEGSPLRFGGEAQQDGSREEPLSKSSSLRRVNSDQSLLYHSLSRSSSLGDDSRFEHHHEMVNSRLKAIRDSLQDRSSFRLPSMPSMPSMPSISSMPRSPSFSRAMNFASSLSLNRSMSLSWRNETDVSKGIIAGNPKKKGFLPTNATPPSGLLGSRAVTPDPTAGTAQATTDGPRTEAFDRAIESLTGDVVILGGYRGSILRSAKHPHRQLWVPVKVGLNIRKVNMEVGLEREDEERMEETIFASGMLQNIGPVDISRRLFKRLRDCENAKNGTLRVWDYGYDWRLSPHLLSRRLEAFLQKLPCNKSAQPGGALVIAHSLGGLITRHVVNKRPELFSGVIYAGVPQACVNILGPLRNGDAVLLSSRVLTAQVNFTLRTSFALLPLEGYCFEDKYTREKYTVDFFDVNDWIKYRFSPCTDPPLPPKAPPQSGLANMLKSGSFTNLQLPGKRPSTPGMRDQGNASPALSPRGTHSGSNNSPIPNDQEQTPAAEHIQRAAEAVEGAAATDRTIAPQMGNLSNPVNRGQSTQNSISTMVTIPRPKAIAYLTRVLAEVKKFKQELAHDPSHSGSNRYPPLAVIYGKSVPTVCAARVDGRDGIACADVYEDLAFASGDGVCLAKEAMLPSGYLCVRGGRISSDRGHVTLLGDLNAVGSAIEAVVKARAKGLGLGPEVKVEGAHCGQHHRRHELRHEREGVKHRHGMNSEQVHQKDVSLH